MQTDKEEMKRAKFDPAASSESQSWIYRQDEGPVGPEGFP